MKIAAPRACVNCVSCHIDRHGSVLGRGAVRLLRSIYMVALGMYRGSTPPPPEEPREAERVITVDLVGLG